VIFWRANAKYKVMKEKKGRKKKKSIEAQPLLIVNTSLTSRKRMIRCFQCYRGKDHIQGTNPTCLGLIECQDQMTWVWYPISEASVQSQGLISACSPWLVRRVLGLCVAAKNKAVRGTWVEALDMGGLGGPKRTISC
jgi:hypothetical protein